MWGTRLSMLHDRWGDNMRDYMDRRAAPPKLVNSTIRGPPPPCKQALNVLKSSFITLSKAH